MPHLTVNGFNMHYEDRGVGEPLLLIHGLGTGSADWFCQVPALSEHYRVIAPCLRGFGRSERVQGDYSIALFAQDLAALLDELDIDRSHICGLSMGGAVAFQFAVDYGQRLSSLVAINSQPTFELDSWKKKLLFHSRGLMARWLGLDAVARFQLRQNFPGAANADLRQRLSGRFTNDPDIYQAALAALENWSVTDRLNRIAVPTLVIAAEFDYSTPAEKARLVQDIADHRVIEVSGARHAVHLECPDEVNRLLLEFLQGVSADSGDQSGHQEKRGQSIQGQT
ncbi:MAG: alpha/beta hydrolase [Gammaproteobacteria bacterium]|nr:alpha/beta hydrolase [Gammaproteobacteria bacterium]